MKGYLLVEDLSTIGQFVPLKHSDWKVFSFTINLWQIPSLQFPVPNISNSVKIGSIWCQFNGHSLDRSQAEGSKEREGVLIYFFNIQSFD